MRFSSIILGIVLVVFGACRESRIHEHNEWGKYFESRGIKNGCFMLDDNNHETVAFYNKERCLQHFSPASTFKIFNSLVALETGIAPDDQLIIKWDGIDRGMPEWNKDMTMREAFKVSNVGYYQEIARRIGMQTMQHYIDTANYGNRHLGNKVDEFWLNDSLQISADEQVGLVKRMYFAELPFSERSQRIVKSMMLQEETPKYRLYYKTGWGKRTSNIIWVVGFAERIEHMKEHENSMNKSNERNYPYFFAMNFAPAAGDTSVNYFKARIDIVKEVLKSYNALRD